MRYAAASRSEEGGSCTFGWAKVRVLLHGLPSHQSEQPLLMIAVTASCQDLWHAAYEICLHAQQPTSCSGSTCVLADFIAHATFSLHPSSGTAAAAHRCALLYQKHFQEPLCLTLVP